MFGHGNVVFREDCYESPFQVIELYPEQLEGEEVLGILRQERSPLNVWVTVAVSRAIVLVMSQVT